MPKVIVLYPPRKDAAAFERRYTAEHAPMVHQQVPGLKKVVAAKVLGTPATIGRISGGLRFPEVQLCDRPTLPRSAQRGLPLHDA